MTLHLAFDRSMRRIDEFGRMHVEMTAISKAVVNPYYGREIPDWKALGLDADRVYYLLRDPDELAKAAPTFNNIPLLNTHAPATADNPQKQHRVGNTGTDCVFVEPYLMNSLVIDDALAIAGINSKDQCELSCSYLYRPDMTSGEFNGTRYDGVMRDIRGNHVALVEQGRAGPDVYVFDSKPPMEQIMKKPSRLAVAVRSALAAHLVPMLAADAALGDLGALVGSPKKKTFAADSARIVAEAVKACKGKLATDSALDADKLARVLKFAADEAGDDPDVDAEDEDPEDPKDPANDDDPDDPKDPANDDDPDDDGKKGANDAAIRAAEKRAEERAVARINAIHVAREEVQPILGKLAADAAPTAAGIYKLALDHMGVDVTDVHPSAYRALVKNLSKPAEKPRRDFANDAASVSNFAQAFPTAKIPRRG